MGPIDTSGLVFFSIIGMVAAACGVGALICAVVATPYALWTHNIDPVWIGGLIGAVVGPCVLAWIMFKR